MEFTVDVRTDTPGEMDYHRHGAILPCVLHQLRDNSWGETQTADPT